MGLSKEDAAVMASRMSLRPGQELFEDDVVIRNAHIYTPAGYFGKCDVGESHFLVSFPNPLLDWDAYVGIYSSSHVPIGEEDWLARSVSSPDSAKHLKFLVTGNQAYRHDRFLPKGSTGEWHCENTGMSFITIGTEDLLAMVRRHYG